MLKKFHLIAITALIAANAATLTGCSDTTSTGPSAPRHEATTVTRDGLELTVSTAKPAYEYGETIGIKATITNPTDQPITLEFERGRRGRYPNISVNVRDNESDYSVYVGSDGDRDELTLAPGKSMSYRFEWDQMHRGTRQPADRDFYQVRAFCGLSGETTMYFRTLHIELK